MVITPDKYNSVSVRELLDSAAHGRVALDQRWVRAIVERGEPAADELVAFGIEEREGDVIDLEEDITAMLRFLRNERAIPFFIESIRRHPEEVSDELLSAFLELGAPSLEPLLALFHELGQEEGGEVAFILAALRIHDPRVRQILLDRLCADPTDAAIAISLYGDPGMKPALEERLATLDADDSATDTERRELNDAVRSLDAPHAEPFQGDFDLWELYPEQSAPPFSALTADERLEFFDSSLPEHRSAAAESFANESHTKEVRERLLGLAEKDPEVAVRAKAWRALAESSDDKRVRSAMMARLKDPSLPLEERCGALIGLSLEPDETVEARMREFYDIPGARAAAMEAMWRSLDRQFSDYFPRHLDDPDTEVKRQAVWGVGYLGIHSEAARLRKLFEDEELREDALFAYSLAVPAEISRGRIKGVLRKIEQDAGGLSEVEEELVQVALDQRLAFHGDEPVFFADDEDDHHDHDHGDGHAHPQGPQPVPSKEPGRNDPCPCGSGKKYKKCCGAPA